MELPDSIKAIGEQVEAGGEVTPAPELFQAYDVFSAEVAGIFTRPWLAAEHHSRLAADGDFFRVDVGPRSVVVVREKADRIHAMRNACLHAGYRVCEAEDGRSDHLYCVYHGWSYALDGRLIDPVMRPDMEDRSRFRLPRYAMRIERGLVFVDPSKVAPEAPPPGPIEFGALPEDLAERPVSGRQRYQTTENWKRVRRWLWDNPGLAFGNGCDEVVEFGPLSLVALRDGDAALIRLVPRFPGNTDIELVMLPRPGGARQSPAAIDPIGDALREHEAALAETPLGSDFWQWYWSMLPRPEAAA